MAKIPAQDVMLYGATIASLLDGVTVANNESMVPSVATYIIPAMAIVVSTYQYVSGRLSHHERRAKLDELALYFDTASSLKKDKLVSSDLRYQQKPESKGWYIPTTTGKTALGSAAGFTVGYGLVKSIDFFLNMGN